MRNSVREIIAFDGGHEMVTMSAKARSRDVYTYPNLRTQQPYYVPLPPPKANHQPGVNRRVRKPRGLTIKAWRRQLEKKDLAVLAEAITVDASNTDYRKRVNSTHNTHT